MKVYEVINHITSLKMPDIEQVREKCLNQKTAEISADNTNDIKTKPKMPRLKRITIIVAVVMTGIILMSAGGLYWLGRKIFYTDGSSSLKYEWYKPRTPLTFSTDEQSLFEQEFQDWQTNENILIRIIYGEGSPIYGDDGITTHIYDTPHRSIYNYDDLQKYIDGDVFKLPQYIPDGYEFSNASITFFVDLSFDIENEEPIYREEKFGNIYEKYYIPENFDNINGIFVSYTNGEDCWIHYDISQAHSDFLDGTFGGLENTAGEVLKLPQFDRDILLTTPDYDFHGEIVTHRSFTGITLIKPKPVYGFDIVPGTDIPKRYAYEYKTARYNIITHYLSRDEIVKMAESIK